MALPGWNREWEKPDLLRGKRGWSLAHYLTVGVAVILLVPALGLLVPAVVKVRDREQRLDRLEGLLRAAIFPPSEGWPGPR